MPPTDPVSSITNCYRLIVSSTVPEHSFIISKRTIEPTGSSFKKEPVTMAFEVRTEPPQKWKSSLFRLKLTLNMILLTMMIVDDDLQ